MIPAPKYALINYKCIVTSYRVRINEGIDIESSKSKIFLTRSKEQLSNWKKFLDKKNELIVFHGFFFLNV